MRYLAVTAFAFGALCAAPGFAQNRPAAGPAYSTANGTTIQQQQAIQQTYSQGQAAIQSGSQGHAQSQQLLSTMAERNQAQLDAQAPRGPSSILTNGSVH